MFAIAQQQPQQQSVQAELQQCSLQRQQQQQQQQPAARKQCVAQQQHQLQQQGQVASIHAVADNSGHGLACGKGLHRQDEGLHAASSLLEIAAVPINDAFFSDLLDQLAGDFFDTDEGERRLDTIAEIVASELGFTSVEDAPEDILGRACLEKLSPTTLTRIRQLSQYTLADYADPTRTSVAK